MWVEVKRTRSKTAQTKQIFYTEMNWHGVAMVLYEWYTEFIVGRSPLLNLSKPVHSARIYQITTMPTTPNGPDGPGMVQILLDTVLKWCPNGGKICKNRDSSVTPRLILYYSTIRTICQPWRGGRFRFPHGQEPIQKWWGRVSYAVDQRL